MFTWDKYLCFFKVGSFAKTFKLQKLHAFLVFWTIHKRLKLQQFCIISNISIHSSSKSFDRENESGINVAILVFVDVCENF